MNHRLLQFFQRLFSIFRRRQIDQDLDAELASHLELAFEENLQSGMPPEEARRQALVRVGGIQRAREQHRDARGFPALDTFFQDVRYALRGILKSPGFSIAAVGTLAMGIAVNATIFSMVSGFLLRPPPGREPERVLVITSVSPTRGFVPDANPVSAPNYLAWRSASNLFENMAADGEYRSVNLTRQGQTTAKPSAAVSPEFFTVLGADAQLGRTFSAGDDQPGRDHVVILSHELYDREFGSDPSIVGKTIRLSREDYTVIGVMPASFHMLGFTPQLWTPLVINASDQSADAHNNRSLFVFARLKPGVSLEQARAEVSTFGRRTEQDFPETEKGWGITARTLPDFLIHLFGIRGALAVMMTAVVFVLLIACANVAGLLLARAATRRKELAIRMSLGASRLRIVRQLLTEGLIIASLGGGLGVLWSYWGIKFLQANMKFNEAVQAVHLSLDWNVLLFALGVSILSAVVSSLAPAMSASRTDVNAGLKDESRSASAGRSRSRFRTMLVTAEIAASLFLLTGTGLLLRGIYRVEHQTLGFQAENLLTANIALDSARYGEASKQSLFVKDLIGALQQLADVKNAAVVSDLPATGADDMSFLIHGRPEVPPGQRPRAIRYITSSGYFQTAGVPLLRGRAFTEADNAGAPPVIIVNQEFVRRHFKEGEDPLGKEIRLDANTSSNVWSRIVGVVADVKTFSELSRFDPNVYEPLFQRPLSSFSLMVRTNSAPEGRSSALRKTIARMDAELPLARVMSMSTIIEQQKGGDQLFVQMLAAFALLALLLATIGIYGLISYSIGQRSHELAIRMALGASAREVQMMILFDGMKMAGIGAVVGLLAALPLPNIFIAVLNDLRTGGPWIYVIVMVTVVSVSLLATYLPARRASRIDPMRALHSE
jgi:putative ABC transport system permease protein